jgi:phosphoglycolate phosphatase-like HAD superfamily hydrolase
MEQLPVIRERFGDLAVCSTKDKATIELILDNYGQKYSVYGREHSKYKPDQINDLAAEKKVNPNRIIFIDDLIENLQHVKTTGAICVMTRWGYNNPAEWKRAADLGFKLISMDDIAGQLEEIIKPEGTE